MSKLTTKAVGIGAAAAVAIWFVLVALQGFLSAKGIVIFPADFTLAGQFGDSFGPINTVMALVAAISATAAFFAQREELARVRNDSRDERLSSERRDFEQTFFNLLSLFKDTLNGVTVPNPGQPQPRTGRTAIIYIIEEIGNFSGYSDFSAEVFRRYYDEYRDSLAHYFRIFYHILKFVHNSNVEDKQFYANLLRATLSEPELVIIALNCMYGGGRRKLTPLMEKYAMLHNISSGAAKSWQMNYHFKRAVFANRKVSDWSSSARKSSSPTYSIDF